jgi:hypothetical protein
MYLCSGDDTRHTLRATVELDSDAASGLQARARANDAAAPDDANDASIKLWHKSRRTQCGLAVAAVHMQIMRIWLCILHARAGLRYLLRVPPRPGHKRAHANFDAQQRNLHGAQILADLQSRIGCQ